MNVIKGDKAESAAAASPARVASLWWRLGAALLAAGLATALAAGRTPPAVAGPAVAGIVGWNAFAATFLSGLGFLILTNDAPLVRARAQRQDVNRAVLTTLILAAMAASLGAMVLALHDAKAAGKAGLPPWLIVLSVSTLVLSWMLVQGMLTLHYAHRYFADRDDNGADDGGVGFPGEKPTSYRDFLYMAVCVGATCQVSDFDITTTRFRQLVTTHALIAFAFNTMVLALGVNIIGNLMGS